MILTGEIRYGRIQIPGCGSWSLLEFSRQARPCRPQVQKYCLMGSERSYTGSMIESPQIYAMTTRRLSCGLWRKLRVVTRALGALIFLVHDWQLTLWKQGMKVFYFVEPTDANLQEYMAWSTSPKQSHVRDVIDSPSRPDQSHSGIFRRSSQELLSSDDPCGWNSVHSRRFALHRLSNHPCYDRDHVRLDTRCVHAGRLAGLRWKFSAQLLRGYAAAVRW